MFLAGTRAKVIYSSFKNKLGPRSGGECFVGGSFGNSIFIPITKNSQPISSRTLFAAPITAYFYKYGNQQRERVESRNLSVIVPLMPASVKRLNYEEEAKAFINLFETGEIFSPSVKRYLTSSFGRNDDFGLMIPIETSHLTTEAQLSCWVRSLTRTPHLLNMFLSTPKEITERNAAFCHQSPGEFIASIFRLAKKGSLDDVITEMYKCIEAGTVHPVMSTLQKLAVIHNKQTLRKECQSTIMSDLFFAWVFQGAMNYPEIMLERRKVSTDSGRRLAIEHSCFNLIAILNTLKD